MTLNLFKKKERTLSSMLNLSFFHLFEPGKGLAPFLFAFFLSLFSFTFISLAHGATLRRTNPTQVQVADFSSSSSSVDFSDLPPKGEITNIAINYSIQHPSPGDLDIWITTYYDGSWHDYYLYSSGEITMQNSFSERRSSLPFWDGFPPNLTWYLVVKDNFFGARGLIDFFEVAISYSLPPSEVPAGSLEVTVRNLQGTLVENARVVPFGNTIGALDVFTDRSGKARWDNISQGDYWVEVYYGGTSFGEEYWGDSAIRVENGVVAELGFVRFYPFIKKVILKNAVTETVIPPDEVLPTDTIVRAEISVGNNVFWPLDVQVRVVVDGNQEPPYDTSVNSAIQRVPGHGEDIFFVEFTLNQPGKAFSGFTVQTSLFNGEQIITDTRGWSQAFITAFPPVDANVSLLSFTTDKGGYGFNDPVHGEVRLENNGPDSLTDVHLFVDFVGPQGTFTGGSRSGTFTVQSGDSVTLSLNSLFQLGAGDPSGAYEPRVTLRDSINRPLAEFTTETPGGVVPLIPMGAFPRLKQLIVRSQQHFDPFDSASVQETFREFVHNGFNTLSMSIKLDDGPGEWRFLSQPSPVSGQVLFNSATATGTAKNPLSYDLYGEAQTAARDLGIRLNPWIPTFFDEAQSKYDNTSWRLLDDPVWAPDQGLVDLTLSGPRDYEMGIISDSLASPYKTPDIVNLDYVRVTNGQHGALGVSQVTAFAKNVKSSLPLGTKLSMYMWLPADVVWSGQDYSQLAPYLDEFSPMMYWQDGQLSGQGNVSLSLRDYVRKSLEQITTVLGQGVTSAKLRPTFDITTDLSFFDSQGTNLSFRKWKRYQLNLLGLTADMGILGYDLFYYGNWFWPVYQQDPASGRWIDWAWFLKNLPAL